MTKTIALAVLNAPPQEMGYQITWTRTGYQIWRATGEWFLMWG